LGDFQKIVGNVRAALIRQPNHEPHQSNGLTPQPADLPALRQLELVSQFGHELERVGGKFSGLISPSDLYNQLVQFARDSSIRSAALGDGISVSSNRIAETLAQARVVGRPIRHFALLIGNVVAARGVGPVDDHWSARREHRAPCKSA